MAISLGSTITPAQQQQLLLLQQQVAALNPTGTAAAVQQPVAAQQPAAAATTQQAQVAQLTQLLQTLQALQQQQGTGQQAAVVPQAAAQPTAAQAGLTQAALGQTGRPLIGGLASVNGQVPMNTGSVLGLGALGNTLGMSSAVANTPTAALSSNLMPVTGFNDTFTSAVGSVYGMLGTMFSNLNEGANFGILGGAAQTAITPYMAVPVAAAATPVATNAAAVATPANTNVLATLGMATGTGAATAVGDITAAKPMTSSFMASQYLPSQLASFMPAASSQAFTLPSFM
jgi:hypothetical protein